MPFLNLYFKLLFLLPNIKIKKLKRLVKVIRKLRFKYRKNIISDIYRKYNKLHKRYRLKFKKVNKNRTFKKNIITYKVKGTYLFLQWSKNKDTMNSYLKYNKNNKKQRLQNYESVSFNQNIGDQLLYKSFLLKNNRMKWYLNKSFHGKSKNNYGYKKIFVWPFTIIIKPFIVIIKNIFFKPFFIFKKWFKRIYDKNRNRRKKLYSPLYKIILIKAKQSKIDHISSSISIYYWYMIQKYLLLIDKEFKNKSKNQYINIDYNKYNNLFYRSLSKYKQFFNKNRKMNYKKRRNSFFFFYNSFLYFIKKSLIGLSFFSRLYCLYFFWFIFFINNLYYFINKIIYNYWIRFYYFTFNLNNLNYSQIFISYSKLYKKINYINKLEYENHINKLLYKVINVIYMKNNLYLKITLNNIFYKKYYLMLFYYYFHNYFSYNSFENYKLLFTNNLKKDYKNNNNFFDNLYLDNYKYSNLYKLEYFIIQQKIYKKYYDKNPLSSINVTNNELNIKNKTTLLLG